MTRMWIVSVGIAMGISGSASIASAAPSKIDEVSQRTSIGANFAISLDDPCLPVELEFGAFDTMIHSVADEDQEFGMVVGSLFVWDAENGRLFIREGGEIVPDAISGTLDSATVSLELEASMFQCIPDPTCSGQLQNCVSVGLAPFLVDLTWVGIGNSNQVHQHTRIDSEEWVVAHSNTHAKIRDAIVNGTFSVGGLEFDIEDELGEIVTSTRTIVEICAEECED